MIIDSHSHACGRFLTPEGIVRILDESGVDKVVLVPGELNSKSEYSLPNIAYRFPKNNVVKITNFITQIVMKLTGKVKDIPIGNELVYNLKTQTSNRVIQFLWITKDIENTISYLESKYGEWAFHGVKMHQCWEKFSIDSVFFEAVAQWSEEKDLPLFIHLYSDKEVLKLIEYKRKHPKLKLIVAHLFGLELFIKENLIDKNLYFDTSPLQLISDFRFRMAIDYIGTERVIFGTDTPYGAKNNHQKSISRIKNLGISNDGVKNILGMNIKRLLKI